MAVLGTARLRLFGISDEEARFSTRGFHVGDPYIRERLERIGLTFLHGYRCALRHSQWATTVREIDEIPLDVRGFAYEGASMAVALWCAMVPGKWRRFAEWCNGPAERHLYMAYVGAGWATARLPWLQRNIEDHASALDLLLGWLVLNGYGFHQGYFHPALRNSNSRLTIRSRRIFDEGLGRSLWFNECGDVDRIAGAIANLPASRHADLWSGIGLAATYAGVIPLTELIRLRSAAGPFAKDVAQGSAFAAKARQRAGNLTDYTETACIILCGSSAKEAAAATDRAMAAERTNVMPDYLRWRQRIANELGGDREMYGHHAPAC